MINYKLAWTIADRTHTAKIHNHAINGSRHHSVHQISSDRSLLLLIVFTSNLSSTLITAVKIAIVVIKRLSTIADTLNANTLTRNTQAGRTLGVIDSVASDTIPKLLS